MEAQNSNKNILTHAHDEDYRFRIWSKLETFKNAVDEQVGTQITDEKFMECLETELIIKVFAKVSESCIVCTDPLSNGAKLHLLGCCGAVYHKACLDTWWVEKPTHTCPNCQHRHRQPPLTEQNPDQLYELYADVGEALQRLGIPPPDRRFGAPAFAMIAPEDEPLWADPEYSEPEDGDDPEYSEPEDGDDPEYSEPEDGDDQATPRPQRRRRGFVTIMEANRPRVREANPHMTARELTEPEPEPEPEVDADDEMAPNIVFLDDEEKEEGMDDEEEEQEMSPQQQATHLVTVTMANAGDDWKTHQTSLQQDLETMTDLATPDEDMDEDELLRRLRLASAGANDRRGVAVLSAYNAGVLLNNYCKKNQTSRRQAVEDVAIRGLGKSSANDFCNFAEVISKFKAFSFVFLCEEPWRDVRLYLKKSAGRNSPSYLEVAFTEWGEMG